MAIASYKDLCIDARDVPLVARFWGQLLDFDVEVRTDGVAALGVGGDVVLWVDPVPEPKVVKKPPG